MILEQVKTAEDNVVYDYRNLM